jgi:hypothetical protein
LAVISGAFPLAVHRETEDGTSRVSAPIPCHVGESAEVICGDVYRIHGVRLKQGIVLAAINVIACSVIGGYSEQISIIRCQVAYGITGGLRLLECRKEINLRRCIAGGVDGYDIQRQPGSSHRQAGIGYGLTGCFAEVDTNGSLACPGSPSSSPAASGE